MNRGKTVFAQLLELISFGHFEHLADHFAANRSVSEFTAWSHLLCLTCAQQIRRKGLRDLVAWLNSQHSRLYHIGIRARVSRSALADANERRDWRLSEALGQRLIAIALKLYRDENIRLDLNPV